MNPTKCEPLTEENAAQNRRLLCVSYGDCIDIAMKKNWKSFTCNSCSETTEFNREAELYHIMTSRKSDEGTPQRDLMVCEHGYIVASFCETCDEAYQKQKLEKKRLEKEAKLQAVTGSKNNLISGKK